MIDEEPDEESAYKSMTAQAQAQSLAEEATELAEYVREFSEERGFRETQQGIQGNIPVESKLKYWSINSPNLVWSNFPDKRDVNWVEGLSENIDMIESMYDVNMPLLEAAIEHARKNKNHIELQKLERIRDFKNNTLMEANQRIQTRARTMRGYSGQGNIRERLTFITKGIMSQNPGNDRKSRGVMDRLLGRR